MSNKGSIYQNQMARNSMGKLSQHLQQINGRNKMERGCKLLKSKRALRLSKCIVFGPSLNPPLSKMIGKRHWEDSCEFFF